MFRRLASALLLALTLSMTSAARGDALVVASYYNQPGITASGERFNPNVCTAAHKRAPFNTVIKFTNLKNNKSVNARVNDRFPQTKGRDYDLSIQCAKKLGFIKQGIIHLRAQIVK